jgi:hypothetical protein
MIICLDLSDHEWLKTCLDLEDLEEYDILRLNLRYRIHLIVEKRALMLQHLRMEN